MEETYRFIRRNPLSLVNIYVLMPLPGTPVWHDAKAGAWSPTTWTGTCSTSRSSSAGATSILISETVSREELHADVQRLRRLRLAKTPGRSSTHPFQMDLPEYGRPRVEWAHRVGILRAPTGEVHS